MPQTCTSDFDCLQMTRPPNWPREHATVQSGNYACVLPKTSKGNNSTSTGICQFVVTAGEQCNTPKDCAVFTFYTKFGLSVPDNLCSPHHCTIESSCGSPWQGSIAPSDHTFTNVKDNQISCCGGQAVEDICSLVGSNVDSCEYHSTCSFALDDFHSDNPNENNGYTFGQMRQQDLGFCQKIDQRKHVWIGVVITLISSTVLNLGLNGQKYALRKYDEERVLKQLEMEEEHERWRQERGWTDEQVQNEADRLFEEEENKRGKLYRKLKPYMFWRKIIVSKLWAAGLLVFIVGNLGGFIALRFAPQSLTAPLGSISLISNVIIAPLINKEVLGKWDVAGIFFIVAGSVIVVVFSGIVAQDYKLCVLINLFHKPATIVYLTLIGVCIIATFFFIRFVEKNVENEADVAIGVSSERVLQKEGRLYRLNSSRSSLSLSIKGRHESIHGALAAATTTPSDASRTAIGGALGVETGHSQNRWRPSFDSNRNDKSSRDSRLSTASLEKDASMTAEAGSSAVDQQGRHLEFEESISPQEGSSRGKEEVAIESNNVVGITPNYSPVPPTPSTNQLVRRRRNRAQSNKHDDDDGTPLTVWERIKRIEVIPSLPEDKLIRRNSPLLRFCLPLSYAALGGMMASYTVLFAKSLINLLVTSIFDGDNQFTSAIAWVILIFTVVTAVSQVYWINMGLKKYDALLQVPVFFTIWVLLDIIGGGIYYDEFRGFTAEKYVLFCVGVLVVFFGVALLAKRLALLAKEDVGESQAASVAASRTQSILKGEAPANH